VLISQLRAAPLSRSAFTAAVAAGSAWSGLRGADGRTDQRCAPWCATLISDYLATTLNWPDS
jgi:hypothetical protein